MSWLGFGYVAPWLTNGGMGHLGGVATPPIIRPPTQAPPIDYTSTGDAGMGDTPPAFSYDDAAARHRAQAAGSGALVAGLLASYLNRGRGLDDAFKAQRDASQEVLARAHEEAARHYQTQHQGWEDRRQMSQDEVSRKAAAQESALRDVQLHEHQDKQAQQEARNAHTPDIYQQFVADFGESSPEARQAKAVLAAGGDTAFDDLRDLYQKSAESRARQAERAAVETRSRRDDSRADQYLGLARQQAAARESAGVGGGSSGGHAPTDAQYFDDVEKEIDRLVPLTELDHLHADPVALDKRREAARPLAEARVQALYAARGHNPQAATGDPSGGTHAGPPHGARLHYNPATGELE